MFNSLIFFRLYDHYIILWISPLFNSFLIEQWMLKFLTVCFCGSKNFSICDSQRNSKHHRYQHPHFPLLIWKSNIVLKRNIMSYSLLSVFNILLYVYFICFDFYTYQVLFYHLIRYIHIYLLRYWKYIYWIIQICSPIKFSKLIKLTFPIPRNLLYIFLVPDVFMLQLKRIVLISWS